MPDRLPALLSGSLENGATGLLQSGSLPREEEVETARQELAAEARVAGVQRIEVDPPSAPHPYAAEAAAPMMRALAPVPAMASAAGETEIVVRVLATLRLAPEGAAGP